MRAVCAGDGESPAQGSRAVRGAGTDLPFSCVITFTPPRLLRGTPPEGRGDSPLRGWTHSGRGGQHLIMLKRTALVLLFLMAALFATGYALLRGSLPLVDGEVTLTGLGAPVTVERDAQGVPTVRGTTRLDVARVTGFLHGQDRYFQMDLLRRQAAGELSALVGARALEADRKQRLHRMRDLAGRILRGLPVNERALIDAYTEGVNAGLAHLRVR